MIEFAIQEYKSRGYVVLVFIDESYKQANHANPKTTYGVVLVEESQYREFDTKLFNLKKKFFKVSQPHEMELKGRLLLSERAIEMPKNRSLIEQILYLCQEMGIVLFALTQDGTISMTGKSDRLPDLYKGILWRINAYMNEKRPDGVATLFFDDVDRHSNMNIAINFTSFMYRHAWGRGYTNILPVPFFCNSVVSPGIQIADIVAYCVNERYTGRRGYLEDVFQELRELSYNSVDQGVDLYGIQAIPIYAESTEADEIETEKE